MAVVKAPVDGRAERPFELLPALDLRGGRVVRLVQGDFARETVYGDDPNAVVDAFARAGAGWVHVVDLDGARAGVPVQTATVGEIIRAADGRLRVEVGGGLRDRPSVARVLELGAARVVVGTAALADPAFVGSLVTVHGPDRIAVALDVRDGAAVGHGWRAGAPGTPIVEAVSRMTDAGVETLIVTAIERDGRLEGPDLDLLEGLARAGRGRVIASGGISSTEDVLAARSVGCAGAIVGRAMYEGRIDLAATLRALGATADPGRPSRETLGR
ncbi:MAG TPA: 1-(5-phosphoribosyl)-5-[(5-phosphoribosylamino)methylideneamino] imidazole-4-carboxamide isomerase [Patescibacteria group bacterium]|nr:1-(5-phosphoribosyl)-5-[(5-phosphoribosylamino)methylideneamino] imidazole-4-carboxamide isomerase [Patescibacteria group bacterium]